MNNEVNLIANRKKSSAEKEKLIRLIRIIAFASLGIVVVLSITLYILNQDTSFTELSNKEKTTLAGLSISSKKIASFLASKQRLKDIDSILAKRSNYDVIISDLAKGVPTGARIDSFSLNKEEVSIILSSSSLEDINSFLSFMVDALNTKKTYRSLSITGVSADTKNNNYSLILQAKFL